MRSVIESRRFQENDMELPIALGKTISNTPFVFDLAKLPHLLIVGVCGSEKSAGLNAVISSILYKQHPS
jgi:S-DNA-T family DNA segregation ATPase FtsK/SpoIIIE